MLLIDQTLVGVALYSNDSDLAIKATLLPWCGWGEPNPKQSWGSWWKGNHTKADSEIGACGSLCLTGEWSFPSQTCFPGAELCDAVDCWLVQACCAEANLRARFWLLTDRGTGNCFVPVWEGWRLGLNRCWAGTDEVSGSLFYAFKPFSLPLFCWGVLVGFFLFVSEEEGSPLLCRQMTSAAHKLGGF